MRDDRLGQRILGALFTAAAIAVLSTGCGGAKPTGAPAPDTLFDRLGGKVVIVAVVDDFVEAIRADERIAHYFVEVDIARLKQLLVEQICEETGGPCTYSGRSMLATHTGMNISEQDWAITVEALSAALTRHRVATRDADALLATLGEMRGHTVGQ